MNENSMIRAYSQRIMPPFSGVVQIAESGRARAQSFDGVSWEIHYLPGNGQTDRREKRKMGYAVDRSYFRVANLQKKKLNPYVLPSCLDAIEVEAAINELSEFLSTAQLPFPAADIFEYWLLDSADASPLALIFSCCEESQIATYPSQTEWTALPHSKMKIENSTEERARHEAPVNHRFQGLVAKRAGMKPRTAWFKRVPDETGDFPGFLVRDDWQEEADHDLCQRYLLRKAPRLLMLQSLSQGERERLEVAAKRHALEVDQYFPLYPAVNDQRRMAAIRVEARLRRDTPHAYEANKKERSSSDAPLSRELRILE